MNTLIEIIGWLGSVCIFAGLYGVAHKRRNAFFFSIVGELAWVVKSVYLHAWDLLSMTIAFAVLAAYGYYAWGKAERDEARQAADRVKQAQAADDARRLDKTYADVQEHPENYRVAWLNEQGEEVRLTAYEKHIAMQYLASLALAGANGKVTLAQIAAARKDATY